jgi:hypothetical protein
MRIVRALFENHEIPDGVKDFFFLDDEQAERWCKNLPSIRRELPFSSVFKPNGITLYSCKQNSLGFCEIDEELWKSTNL